MNIIMLVYFNGFNFSFVFYLLDLFFFIFYFCCCHFYNYEILISKNYHLLAAKSDENCSVQLIDGDGGFNVDGIDSFIKDVKLGECGLSYAVVSIMGPQSSGK